MITKKERFEKVIAWFQQNKPLAETELHYASPYELLVSVILSAQCTDKRVNLITPVLFNKYPDVYAMALAPVADIFDLIRSCSYPNNKAKHLSGMAQMLVTGFNGTVPSDMELLQKLPGVGRKTANVVASVVFDKPALAVDTHVFRVAARIGLSKDAKNPLETEKQLVRYFPESLLSIAHHWLILHGRYVCVARKPKCNECGLSAWCRYYSNKEKENINKKNV
jgi:endonuclease-3